jgi:Flp pilus assembly secretin CpaC
MSEHRGSGGQAEMLKQFMLATALALLATQTNAQDAKSAEPSRAAKSSDAKGVDAPKNIVPLKVTVVFTEYDGEKKLSSLPYALFLKADDNSHFVGRVRMGVRVPIWTGGKESTIQYQDVGSNLDCFAQVAEDGRYMLDLSLERSSIYPNSGEYPAAVKLDEQPHQPLVRQFRANLALMLRDGQTTQNTIATDPLNGHIVKVEVTLNVVK